MAEGQQRRVFRTVPGLCSSLGVRLGHLLAVDDVIIYASYDDPDEPTETRLNVFSLATLTTTGSFALDGGGEVAQIFSLGDSRIGLLLMQGELGGPPNSCFFASVSFEHEWKQMHFIRKVCISTNATSATYWSFAVAADPFDHQIFCYDREQQEICVFDRNGDIVKQARLDLPDSTIRAGVASKTTLILFPIQPHRGVVVIDKDTMAVTLRPIPDYNDNFTRILWSSSSIEDPLSVDDSVWMISSSRWFDHVINRTLNLNSMLPGDEVFEFSDNEQVVHWSKSAEGGRVLAVTIPTYQSRCAALQRVQMHLLSAPSLRETALATVATMLTTRLRQVATERQCNSAKHLIHIIHT